MLPIRLLCVIMLMCALPLPTGAAEVEERKNLLILNSYHQGYKWTDEISQGAIAGLGKQKGDCRIFVEFMGTKWTQGNSYFTALSEYYTAKFRETRFSLIIATDDDALTFLRLFRNKVFGNIPVVFCGANWFNPEVLQGHQLFTGVNEDADIAATLDLMLQLHPQAQNIHVIADWTTTGQIVRRKIRNLIPLYREKINIHVYDDLEIAEILRQVASLGSRDLILLTLYSKDKSNTFIEFDDFARVLTRHSSVPVYGLWDFFLGHGIVGGMLTSGQAQGRNAGRLVRRILDGESVASIPVVMKSPNHFRFDYRQLERFSIRSTDLPAGSEIINQPPSFYTVNKQLIWILGIGMAGLAAVVVILLVNIHRRSRAEGALRTSEERYHSLIDNLTLGIYRITADREGRLIQVNPAMATLFGYTSMDELHDISISSFYSEPDSRKPHFEELLRTGYLKDQEIFMLKKDRTPIWISANAKAHYDQSGRVDWIDGILEDITEKKKLEMQLRQTQKMEAIGTLAGGIAHDFNNILTAIIGYANLLQMRVGEGDQLRTYIDEILRSSQRAAALTKSLLAFSRKQEMVTRPININDCIVHFETFLARIIGEDIDLQIAPTADDLMVIADRGQIEQVLMNLATNARDAMPGGGMLSIATRAVTLAERDIVGHSSLSPGRYVEISVSDTGSGMDEMTRQRIFEPFFTTKGVGKGTGLGLSILYGIIKQHNGEITVYSEQGEGTTFKIYLPQVTDTVQEQDVELGVVPQGGSETILLIEDDKVLRILEKDILEQFGYRVIEAENGEIAMEKFHEYQEEIDCLLLDVIMPKKNGKEVYEAIRIIRPGIKVLFTSGYTAETIHRQGILAEDLNFLSKPATPTELLRKLRQVLDGKI